MKTIINTTFSFFFTFSFLFVTGCSAQERNPPNFIVIEKKESIKSISKRLGIPIEKIRELNPHLKTDVKRGDTLFTSMPTQRERTAKRESTVTKDSFETKPLGRGNIFAEVIFLKKKYFVSEVNLKEYKIESFNKIESSGSPHNFQTIYELLGRNLVLVMNGGMYEDDFSPLGLLVSNGKVVHEVNTRTDGYGNFFQLPPNGIFLVDSSETPHVVTTPEYLLKEYKPKLATQSGPMLIIQGQMNKSFKEGSENLHVRNGVGVNEKGNVLFVISEQKVNFFEFAQLFRDKLKCQNALYLDGFVSQYFSPELQEKPKEGIPLGVFLAVSKRTAEER